MVKMVNFNLCMFYYSKNSGKPRKQATLFLVLPIPKRKRDTPLLTRKQDPEKPAQLPVSLSSGHLPPETGYLAAACCPPTVHTHPLLGGGEGLLVLSFLRHLQCMYIPCIHLPRDSTWTWVRGRPSLPKPLQQQPTPQTFLIISPLFL